MSISRFPLPDVGEGLTEAEIVTWKVKVGDQVSVNQTICEIETAKSLVELPCPFEGEVTELLAQEGDTVEVGTPIIAVKTAGGPVIDAPIAEPSEEADTGAEYQIPTLVGYGDAGEAKSRRKRAVNVAPVATSIPVSMVMAAASSDSVLAKPPIRKLAKELGVDLGSLTGTGSHGEITREDVIGGASQASVFKNLTTPAVPSEREERIPVKGVRKAIATAMVKSAFTAPHVSIFVDVDATRTMEYVKRLKSSVDFAGIKVTPLLIMAKAMIWAVRRNRMVNSTWTDKEIIVHNFV
ncbi:MAG TPA: dihydrolipoamide acetyltransferase family protein, partial [Aquiluna sp.]